MSSDHTHLPDDLEEFEDDGDDAYLAVDLPDGRSLIVVDGVADEDFDLLELGADDSERVILTSPDFHVMIDTITTMVEPHVAEFPVQAEDGDELLPAVTYREEDITYALVRFADDRWQELVQDGEMLYDGDAFASPVDYLISLSRLLTLGEADDEAGDEAGEDDGAEDGDAPSD